MKPAAPGKFPRLPVKGRTLSSGLMFLLSAFLRGSQIILAACRIIAKINRVSSQGGVMQTTLARWKKRCLLLLERYRTSHGDILRRKIIAVQYLFLDVDRDTGAFRRSLGLSCPEGCGLCCQNPHVQASELELLPLASELDRRRQAEFFYEKADKQDFQGRCIFFIPGESFPGQGKCAQYALRPLLCRLFGFSGNRDRHGHFRLSSCSVLKEKISSTRNQESPGPANSPGKAVFMSDYVSRLSSIDPDLARELVPMNTAFKRAVDRIWLHKKFVH